MPRARGPRRSSWPRWRARSTASCGTGPSCSTCRRSRWRARASTASSTRRPTSTASSPTCARRACAPERSLDLELRAGQEHERLLRGLRHLELERVHPPRRRRLPADRARRRPSRSRRATSSRTCAWSSGASTATPASRPRTRRKRRCRWAATASRPRPRSSGTGRTCRRGSTAPTSSGSFARATTWSRVEPDTSYSNPFNRILYPKGKIGLLYLCATVQGDEGCLYGQTIP